MAMTVVASGCSASGAEKPSEPTASSSAPTNDFETIEKTLDSAGWETESDFDWSDVESSGSQFPEVRAALPSMSSWVKASIFSDEANRATSTRDLLEDVQGSVGIREYEEFADEYDGDADDGLENAAAYGLVLSPTVELNTEPRIAVATEVNKADDGASAAVIDMTARAAIPMTQESINRWGVYAYSLTFTVPKGYEPDSGPSAGYSVATKSVGLMTCEWTTNFSADVADEGMYDPSLVREIIEIAGPRERFTQSDMAKRLSDGPDRSKICES